jgi:hypothetical protein
MPALSCFIDEIDVPLLVKRLNDDPEVAIIVADGTRSVQEVYRDRRTATIDALKAEVGEATSFSFYASSRESVGELRLW